MIEHMLRECNPNQYMQQCIFSVAGIQNGMEGNFSTQFKDIMECAHSSKKFQASRDCHEKEFEFDFLFRCFYDANGKAFVNMDNHMLGVMCRLAALYKAGTLRWCKIQMSDGSNMEFMFCPHCGYFTNNMPTMNMHVCKHYRVALYCGFPGYISVMNNVEAMLQCGSLHHSFGKRNRGTPVKWR